ncbi:TauD/TfdA dioxygenase family protein [Novosphingobium mangrovi (ex Huang et al. 2023)]|uniref:TauD/TfdA family dioxygenase n=1 Tax=Novosphingobium mangrovi (ex Huang et al. 2023) TaxID=2976432 RepID=A0ABT2HZI9_9SPHN|nr:TauD/TfdA family dioxygenase [Novosphingobium mangrovi (ex Huang et al. 2023)]MCT2397971.1 TauD/TfdA family dioxygenase [Novosphingobium mangrovi (ex Huang et al. 2023)]
MGKLDVRPLIEGRDFGVRIRGITLEQTRDPAVRDEVNDLFTRHGMIVFEDVEPSGEMHVALSDIFGPLKDHPSKAVPRVDGDAWPGVIDMATQVNEEGAMTVDGRTVISWLPWHFDHAYNNELNRAGVLRAIDIPPEGGLTGFLDGIELYERLSPELREKIEHANVLYRMNVIMENFRFGRPADYTVHSERPSADAVMEASKDVPRSVHPAVWTRETGEKVLHVSPWMAEGIEGNETPEGGALLDAVSREIFALGKELAYWHAWKPTDMLIWDNWRALHAVSGHDPRYKRRMQRTTIKGDYGLGYFEGGASNDNKILERTY